VADAVAEAIARRGETARAVAAFVYAHPETSYHEERCSSYLADLLAAEGFELERGAGGMETAFVARNGGAGPRVGLVAVYDAVTALDSSGGVTAVHSCGHGSIAGGVTAAALAASDLGRAVSVFGLPADELHADGVREHGGGKERSVSAGLWSGVDAALYAHPEFIDTVSQASLWGRHLEVVVPGERSLRDEAPHASLEAAAAAVRAGRQHPGWVMLERLLLDGDVEEGSRMLCRASFFLFAETEEELDQRTEDVRAVLPEGQWSVRRTIPAIVPDERVTAAVARAFAAAGRNFVADPPPLPFATDFGNISRALPAALIGVGRPGGWAFHTDEGAAQFCGPDGTTVALELADVLTRAVVELGS